MARRRRWAAAAVLLAAPVLAGLPATSAHADSSCSTEITNRLKALPTAGLDYYPATLVIQRGDNSWTSYSWGNLRRTANGHLAGNFVQTFSDRSYVRPGVSNAQQFDAASIARHSVDVGPTGKLLIHSDTYNSDSTTDMTCVGGMLTKYDATYNQLLTLSFGKVGRDIR